jgi:hypothetical protein
MITEAERYKKIGEAVNMFESFQRWLETARPIPKVNPMPPRPRRPRRPRRRIGPSIEQVAVARGIIRAIHQYSIPKEVSH